MPPPRTISMAQIDILLSFLDAHRDLLKRNSDVGTQKEMKKLWEELATHLNAVKDGAQKTGVMWRRYWNEKKYAVRKKASEIQRCINTGKEVKFIMTNEEQKILNLIGCLSGKKERPGKEPVQEGDFSVFDPLDQSSNDNEFLPDEKPEEPIESKPIIADLNLNGSSANDDKTSIVASMCTTDNNITHHTSDGPPQWAIDMEERRVSATERLAVSLERLTSAVVGMHESLRTLTFEVATIREVMVSHPQNNHRSRPS